MLIGAPLATVAFAAAALGASSFADLCALPFFPCAGCATAFWGAALCASALCTTVLWAAALCESALRGSDLATCRAGDFEGFAACLATLSTCFLVSLLGFVF